MKKAKYIWKNGTLIEWDEAQTHVLTHGLHYGSAVFEGLRFYPTDKGPAIFRLKEHTERLFYSAETIGVTPEYSKEEINEAIITVVKENGLKSGYIRPLIYYGYGKMGLNPIGAEADYLVAAWEWGKYLKGETIKCCISNYIRVHPKSVVADAKVSGYYSNSILASLDSSKRGFDEAILLDYEGNVAEGPGENIFIVKNNELFTPKPGNILPGLTRATIINIAKKLNIKVTEKTITEKELFEADEVFLTGTAAEVTPVAQINESTIANGNVGKTTKIIKDFYLDTVTGKKPEFNHYLTYV
jgi:branched-chain amino acid aminotransferase